MLSELEKALSGNEAWKIVYASLLFHFIGIIEQEEKGFSDFQSKINSDRLKEYLRGKIVQISKPLILSFFKWDFNRRSWDEQGLGLKYKKEYISKTIDEIEREINGISDNLAEKYENLFIEFLKDLVTNPSDEFLQQFETKKDKFPKLFQKLKTLEKDNVALFNGEGLFQMFSRIPAKIIDIKNGLVKFPENSDIVPSVFTYALIEYQVYLEQMLQNLEGTDEKMPLRDVFKKAKEYCENDDPEEALKLLLSNSTITQNKKFENALIHQKARWISAKRNEQLGVVSKMDSILIFNQIRISVLELITEIEEDFKGN